MRGNVEIDSTEPVAKTVCGSEITDSQNYPSALYRGEWVYFCTAACLRVYKEEPDRFIAGEIDHPTEDE